MPAGRREFFATAGTAKGPGETPGPFLKLCAPEGNRTPDLWYRKPTLYPLSYEGWDTGPTGRSPFSRRTPKVTSVRTARLIVAPVSGRGRIGRTAWSSRG